MTPDTAALATPFTDWIRGGRKGDRPEPTDEDRRLSAIRRAKADAERAEYTAKLAAVAVADLATATAVAAELATWLPGQGERWGVVTRPEPSYPSRTDTCLILGLPAKALADAENDRISRMEAEEMQNARRFVDLGHLRGRETNGYFICRSMRGWFVGNTDGRRSGDRSPCYQTATEAVQWFTQHRGGPRDVLRISMHDAGQWSAVGGS
jgi:hypothetical protein